MAWKCDYCGEEHPDKLGDCWRCVANEKPIEDRRMWHSAPTPPNWLQRNSLTLVKIWAALASGVMAIFIASFPDDTFFNFYTALFLVSLVSFWGKVRWTAPLIIIGFFSGPLFAPAINGHGAENIRAAVIGAALGLLAGIVIELQGSPPIRGSKHEAIKG